MLDKYGVTMPLECPLHAARDVFAQQEAAKVHVPPQWTCGLCGKAFYHEAHLDRHLDNRHDDYLNNVRLMLSFIYYFCYYYYYRLPINNSGSISFPAFESAVSYSPS